MVPLCSFNQRLFRAVGFITNMVYEYLYLSKGRCGKRSGAKESKDVLPHSYNLETSFRRKFLQPITLTLWRMTFAFCLMSACAQAAIKPAVVAYVFPQNHVIQPGEIAVQKLTRINYAFANIKDGKIIEGF